MRRPLHPPYDPAEVAVQLARLSEGWCPMREDGRLHRDGFCPDCGWWFRTGGIPEAPHAAWTAFSHDPVTIGLR